MRDVFLKLRVFFAQYRWRDRHQWFLDILRHRGDDQMCCDGRHCGCQGVDNRTWWEHLAGIARGRS